MLADYHVHSDFSEDSTTTMKEHITQAIRAGFSEICFTEHLEYGFSLGDWKIDIGEFNATIDGFASQPIQVKKGCEAGIACDREHFRRLKEDIGDHFDFVLVSLHELYGVDPFSEDIFVERNPDVVIRDYIRELYERVRMVEAEGFRFNCVAHIDYLSKVPGSERLPGGQLKYQQASDEIDALFRTVIESGRCIEVNTSPWRSRDQIPPFDTDWLKRYAELGGEYITIGSDAHKPEHTGYGIQEAMELAKTCGIRYFATFEKRQPVLHRL